MWLKNQRWMVDPESGHKLQRMRESVPSFPSCLRAPDCAFWGAAGFHGPLVDQSAKPNHQLINQGYSGGWLNADQFRAAWTSIDYYDVGNAYNRSPEWWVIPPQAGNVESDSRARSPTARRSGGALKHGRGSH